MSVTARGGNIEELRNQHQCEPIGTHHDDYACMEGRPQEQIIFERGDGTRSNHAQLVSPPLTPLNPFTSVYGDLEILVQGSP